MAHPPPFTHLPSQPNNHKNTFIFLHGTSQTGPEIAELLLRFPIPVPSSPGITKTLPDLLPNTKFVFPTGSPKCTTVLGGKITNSWFDIHTFADRTVGEDAGVQGLRESIVYLAGLIEEEIDVLAKDGLKREEARGRVVVGGFSSGAAVAVLGFLSGSWEIGGVVGLSGWLPFRRQIEGVLEQILERGGKQKRRVVKEYVREHLGIEGIERGEEVRGGVKVLLCHGVKDLKMKHEWGLEKRTLLEGMGMQVKWKDYEDLEHWICGDEMLDVVAFLNDVWEGL